MSFKSAMKNMGANWDPGAERGFKKFPAGKYQFKVQNTECTENDSGAPVVKAEYLCTVGEQRGEVYYDYFNLSIDYPRDLCMDRIEELGFEVPPRAQLEERMAEIAEAAPSFTATVTHNPKKDDPSVIYVNLTDIKLVDDDEAEQAPASKPKARKAAANSKPKKGDRVSVDYDGEAFEGEITKTDSKGANIKFDDGETAFHSFKQITSLNGKASADYTLEDVIEFCQAQDIDVDDDDDIPSLAEKIKGWHWKRADLTEKEQTIMDDLEIVLT